MHPHSVSKLTLTTQVTSSLLSPAPSLAILKGPADEILSSLQGSQLGHIYPLESQII